MKTPSNFFNNNLVGILASLTIFLSTQAHAVAVGVDLFIDGQYQTTLSEVDLNCIDNTSAPTAACNSDGDTISQGSFQLDSWSLFLDPDPVISGNVAVTNTSSTAQQFTLIFNLPISPAIPGGTVVGGSVQGGGTDNNGDGATISTASGSSFYSALIDGVIIQTLYNDPQSFSTTQQFGSFNIPQQSFGAPIPSQAGPPALTSIGIQLDFILSGNDTATFSSVFVVEPVPLPAAVWFFGTALGGLLFTKRRVAG